MSFLTALLYDRMMSSVEKGCLREWRSELVEQVGGRVLEIGAGTGANLAFYPKSVDTLVMVEPDPAMRNQLQKVRHISRLKNIEIAAGTAENLPVADGSFDFVVTSLVCCSFRNLEAGLLEIYRILKPGGKLVFLEHVAADEGCRKRAWQEFFNPLWRRVMGNCNLNRDIESAIVSTGFRIAQIKRESMCTSVTIVQPTIRGIAEKL
jgi:ubiquinone/menaquinone biosynthesis C-methylase UbiE